MGGLFGGPDQAKSEQGPKAKSAKQNGTSDLDFRAKLWAAADALRNNMDAAEYKHVVLGLIFLKYISDVFEARHEYLRAAVDDPKDDYFLRPDLPNRSEAIARLLEDKDEYKAVSI